jgi:hypothetical protein
LLSGGRTEQCQIEARPRDQTRLIGRLRIDHGQLFVDPTDEIGDGNGAHEQEQAVRHLVKEAVSQWMGAEGSLRSEPAQSTYGPPCGNGNRRTASNDKTAAATLAWRRRGYENQSTLDFQKWRRFGRQKRH